MIKNTRFIQQLFKELKDWVNLGLITSDQRTSIENLYISPGTADVIKSAVTDTLKSKKTSAKDSINLPKVIIGLATLCLAVGIIIFYASNWRKMPPSLKLVQIFFLIITTYCGAWWFLQAARKFSLVGRSLLLLGMISYGTGIMLVAQIYHISSHPTNGLMAWGIGAFAISILMREKYGIFLSMILFIIWDIWEYSYFGNPGYFFVLPLIITAWFCYKEKEEKGITASALLFSMYFLQVTFYWIEHYSNDGIRGYLMITGFVIAGAVMQQSGKRLKISPLMKNSGTILFTTGWIAYVIPLLQIDQLNPATSHFMIVWGSAILAVSVIMRDRKGYFISAALFLIWGIASPAPAYGYIIPVIILSIIFYIEKDDAGIAVSAVSIICYYYIFNINIFPADAQKDIIGSILVMLQFPLAALLITSGGILTGHKILNNAGRVFTVAGWFFFLLPFTLISWPDDLQNHPLFMGFGAAKIHTAEYIIFSLASAAGLYLIYKKRERITLIFPVTLFSIMVFFLPFNHTATRMITLHLAAVVFIFLLLYYSFLIYEENSFERTFAYIFTIGLLLVKSAGFISNSGYDKGFKLAYLSGLILFITICFLINRLVNEMLSKKGVVFPAETIDAICAIGVWAAIYLASFEVESQKSIFTADSLVIKMTLLFISLSILLYFKLFSIVTTQKVILRLSLIISISSGITLFSTGPSIPWEIYSITFNLLLLITSAVYMYYSTIVQSKKILNFATAGIILHVFTRYFDLFWDMFSGSLLFIITGIMGLAGGYLLEKKRKNLTEMIDTSADDKANQKRVK